MLNEVISVIPHTTRGSREHVASYKPMKLTCSYSDTGEVNNSLDTITHHMSPATLSVAFFIGNPAS